MPGFNRKGPDGQGPMTGRKLGKCNPDNQIENDIQDDEIFGRGLAFRHRRGNGNGRYGGRGRMGFGRGRFNKDS